jgi:Domain of unknown function (DUF5666)
MTEPSGIEFHDRVPAPSGRSTGLRVAMVAGAVVLVAVGVVAVMGASAAATTGADPSASAAPAANASVAPAASSSPGPSLEPRTTLPERGAFPWPGGFALPGGPGRDGAIGPLGFRGVTISAINGSDISLRTVDGWTRTISVGPTTTITKGGATITVGDLAVGDEIRFAQKKAADGSYEVTAIVVVLPTVVGEVTAIDGDTIKVTQPGGTTATIHVDSHTTYRIDGATGSLSGVKVGSFLVAEGTQRADGSLDAAAIRSGLRPSVRGHVGPGNAKPSPAPSSQGG